MTQQLKQLTKRLSELTGKEPQYLWTNEGGIYRLEIFRSWERKNAYQKDMAQHRLTVASYPEKPGKIRPITEEERKVMWFPEFKGPLKESPIDGQFMVEKDETLDGYLPAFRAYFLDGNFVYGSSNYPGFGDVRSIDGDFNTAKEFRKRIQDYFIMKSFNQFKKFFTNSNLPESHRNGIRSLIE